MGNNPYSAWDIEEKDFPEKGSFEKQAKFLIGYAILAPNSHNTQPWKFAIKENTIRIIPDLKRTLDYSDRTHRELYISLGCALGNLLIAAEHFGLEARIDYLPEYDLENIAAVVELKKSKKQSKIVQLFPFIVKRVTKRNLYLEKPVKKKVVNELLAYNFDKDIQVHFVTHGKRLKTIATIVFEAIIFAFSDKIFKEELSRWVRSNYTKKHDGMPLFGFGIPGPISIFAPFLIKNTPAKMQAQLEKKQVEASSALMIITAKTDDKESWLKAGKLYEFLTLDCLAKGIATAPFGGIVEHEESREKLRKLLGIDALPVFFARMGYVQKKPPHSPRRGVKEVIF